MADIINASSGYQTGSIDTATTLVNNVSPTDAKHINGPAGAIVQIETILGSGTTLKGSTADLATRLAVGLDSAGLLKLSTDASISGPLNPTKGGTGLATITDGAVMVGNGTGNVVSIALPSAPRVLCHSGTAGQDPSWLTGLLYHGPTSCGTGSTRSHEGTVVVSSNGNYSGVHYYTDFTLNSSVTMTVPAGGRRLVLIASGTITINGTITTSGAGGLGAVYGGAAAEDGTDQVGGGGGGAGTPGSASGRTIWNGFVTQSATGGSSGTGITGTQLTGSSLASLRSPWDAFGSAGGGSGAISGNGGDGGGSIILIAPIIVLANTATLTTTGTAGGAGGGGGGGGGNVYIITRSYTDNGATFTLTGGAGSSSGGATGGAGAAGVKQIDIYA